MFRIGIIKELFMILTTKRKSKKGFTLVEIIVVLVIIAVLAAIAIPAMTGWIDKASERSSLTEARAVILAAESLLVILYGEAPEVIGILDPSWPDYDTGIGDDDFNPTNIAADMAEVPGENIKKIKSEGVKVVELVYEKGNYRTTYIKGDGFSFEKL